MISWSALGNQNVQAKKIFWLHIVLWQMYSGLPHLIVDCHPSFKDSNSRAWYRFLQAILLGRTNRLNEAVSVLKGLVLDDPHNREHYKTLSGMYAQNGQINQVRRWHLYSEDSRSFHSLPWPSPLSSRSHAWCFSKARENNNNVSTITTELEIKWKQMKRKWLFM